MKGREGEGREMGRREGRELKGSEREKGNGTTGKQSADKSFLSEQI